jgi:hypothetical protein
MRLTVLSAGVMTDLGRASIGPDRDAITVARSTPDPSGCSALRRLETTGRDMGSTCNIASRDQDLCDVASTTA